MTFPLIVATPHFVTQEIENFALELTGEQPLFIPFFAIAGARLGRSALNVRLSNRSQSGRVCYGWRISTCSSLWVEADFHAVKVTAHGLYIDVTPNDAGDTVVLFAPDPKFKPDFDFRQRPDSRRRRIFRPSRVHAEAIIAGFEAARENYEVRKARAHGMTLIQWVLTKTDPLSSAIDEYLTVANEFDQIFVPDMKGRVCTDLSRLPDLHDRMERSQRRLGRLAASDDADRKLRTKHSRTRDLVAGPDASAANSEAFIPFKGR